MNTIFYPARIVFDDEEYTVEFPDLAGCLTCGASYQEALAMGKEALSGYLASVLDRGIELNRPSTITSGLVGIAPDTKIASALRRRWPKEDRELLKQMAGECVSGDILSCRTGH